LPVDQRLSGEAHDLINTIIMNRSTVMTRINKERYTELGILSERYGLTRTQILNDLVQAEFQKLLGEYTANDTTV